MTFRIDHTSPVPLHAQVEQLIRSLIKDPEYHGGKLLPKEEDLARRLAISRNTVRQAMTKLVHEGLIVRKRSVGSVVATQKHTAADMMKYTTFPEELLQRENQLKNLSVEITREISGAKNARMLDIDPDRELLVLKRLKGISQKPAVLFISYFHPRLGLDETSDFEKPLYELIENDYSIVPERSCEDFRAVCAQGDMARLLELPDGAPVLERDRLVLDPGGRPVERNICYYRSDRYTFSINIDISNK